MAWFKEVYKWRVRKTTHPDGSTTFQAQCSFVKGLSERNIFKGKLHPDNIYWEGVGDNDDVKCYRYCKDLDAEEPVDKKSKEFAEFVCEFWTAEALTDGDYQNKCVTTEYYDHP